MHPGERLNAGTHLAGLVLAVAATASLLGASSASGGAVFAGCAVALYAASTLFHSTRGAAKAFWARVDHAAIYLLIAGTYTPFALREPRVAWSDLALAAMWALAWVGVWRELAAPRAKPALALYLGMGWIAVAAVWVAPAALAVDTGLLLLAGAACYTGGTYFYVDRRGLRHAHGAWHLFVLAGSTCHYFAIVGLGG